MTFTATDVIGIFGSIVTLVVGAGAWWNSERANRLEEQVQRERRNAQEKANTADLQKAEISGWQTLIETTRSQYQVMVEQAATLQEKLNEQVQANRDLNNKVDEMEDHITDLTKQLQLLRGGS